MEKANARRRLLDRWILQWSAYHVSRDSVFAATHFASPVCAFCAFWRPISLPRKSSKKRKNQMPGPDCYSERGPRQMDGVSRALGLRSSERPFCPLRFAPFVPFGGPFLCREKAQKNTKTKCRDPIVMLSWGPRQMDGVSRALGLRSDPFCPLRYAPFVPFGGHFFAAKKLKRTQKPNAGTRLLF